jgi:hypothetical protein
MSPFGTSRPTKIQLQMPRLALTPIVSFAQAASGKSLTHLLLAVTGSRRTVEPPSFLLPTELLVPQQGFWSNALSKDTILSYQTRKAKWIEFSTRFLRSPDDLSPKNIVDYITYLATIAKRGEVALSYSTIKAYVDFLGRATSFTSPHLPNPVQHPEVQLFLRGVARTLGKKVEKAEPCSLEQLKALTSWALESPEDAERQTVALVALLAFWGCLRLGALIPKRPEKQAQVLQLQNLDIRASSIIVTVLVSKTIQFGERQHRIELPAQSEPLLCPLRALTRWISALRPQSYQITLCTLSTTARTQLSHSRFLTHVNRVARPPSPLTGHSFRRGFVRLAFARGVPIWQVMHHGDWKTLEVAMSYAEDTLIPNPLGSLSSLDP